MGYSIYKRQDDGKFEIEMRFEGDVFDFVVSRSDMERLGEDLMADAANEDLDDVQLFAIAVDGQMYRTPMSRAELDQLGADLIDRARYTPLSAYEREHGEE